MEQIKGQMTIEEWLGIGTESKLKKIRKEYPEEPEVGAWVETHGAVICHIMRKGYIGKKVVVNKSTQSRRWYKVGILEDYFPYEGTYRAIVYTGEKQRDLITFRPGIEIYECLKWDEYPERMRAIFGERGGD